MQIIISNRAKSNIDEIYMYIAKNSIKYANITINNISNDIDRLKYSPYLGRYVPEIDDKRYQEIIYKSYRIIYEIFEETNVIYIHFVLHGRRNLKSFFNSYIN